MKESEIIIKFSSSFIKRKSRERAIFELTSLKKRMNFVSKIGAMPDFFIFEKFEPVNKSEISYFDKIPNQSKCYVISGFGNYDGLIMTFSEAINNPNFGGSGTIIYDFERNSLLYHEELCYGNPKVYYAKASD